MLVTDYTVLDCMEIILVVVYNTVRSYMSSKKFLKNFIKKKCNKKKGTIITQTIRKSAKPPNEKTKTIGRTNWKQNFVPPLLT